MKTGLVCTATFLTMRALFDMHITDLAIAWIMLAVYDAIIASLTIWKTISRDIFWQPGFVSVIGSIFWAGRMNLVHVIIRDGIFRTLMIESMTIS